MIRITFRLGVVVHKTSRNLLPCSTSAEQRDSWAYVIPDVSSVQVQAELDAWQKAGVRLSLTSYIGSVVVDFLVRCRELIFFRNTEDTQRKQSLRQRHQRDFRNDQWSSRQAETSQ